MHRIPANIVVRHTFGGHKAVIRPEPNGCLGSWNGGNFELEIEPVTGFQVIQIDEDGKVSHPHSVERGRRRSFTISIPLFWCEEEGLLVTKSPSNQIRLLGSTQDSRAWNIIIETREIHFFLSVTHFFLGVQEDTEKT